MAIADFAPKGKKWDFNFPNVYSLNFLDFDLGIWDASDSVLQHVRLLNEECPEARLDFLNFVFVRLPKFSKTLDECESLGDKLLFSLRHAHEYAEKPPQLCGGLFEKIFSLAKIANFTKSEQSDYRAMSMKKWDYGAAIDWAEEKGEKRGITIGEARGMEKGREEERSYIKKPAAARFEQ
jgi:hypothetical protein